MTGVAGFIPVTQMVERRKRLEEDFIVTDGIITSPGKFENEPVYCAAFYELGMEGCEDDFEEGEDGSMRLLFDIKDEDIKAYPELKGYARIAVWSDQQGFVNHELLSE